MACDKYREADIPGFVAEPTAVEWTEFRDHYPHCRECSTELVRWSQFEGALVEAMTASHPSEVSLLAFKKSPNQLPQAERKEISSHLDSCSMCRDALGATLALDLAALTRRDEAAKNGLPERLIDAFRSWMEGFVPANLVPVATVALILVFAFPVGLWLWSGAQTGEIGGTDIAISDQAPEVRVPATSDSLDEAGEQIALAPARVPSEQKEALPEALPEVAPQAVVVAKQAEPEVAPQAVVVAKETQPTAINEKVKSQLPPEPVPQKQFAGSSWIIASLGSDPLLYSSPSSISSPAFIGGIVRSNRTELPFEITALVPKHESRTLDPEPTLYWHLSGRSVRPVEFALNDFDAKKSILVFSIDAPVEAGFHAVDLGAHGIQLKPDHLYQWSVSLVINSDEPDTNPVSGGGLRLVEPDAALRDSLVGASAANRARALAANGIWVDTLDLLSRSIANRPNSDELREQRAELLEQVGLQSPASDDRSANR